MDRRRLLLILAVFVAVIGTALVFLYVQGANNRAASKYDNVDVLKATTNIAAGESYDTALSQGKISLQPVPKSQLNDGYETATTALKGKIAAVPIFVGQQIIATQFSNSVQEAPSSLPIPKGMIAISVNLTDPDRVAGNIQNGSNVAIFVTGAVEKGGAASTAGGAGTTAATTATRLLLPKVTVLNVGSPQPPTTSTSTDSNGTQTTEQLPRTLLTLAVSQKEAEKVILASKTLGLTFGLLTPDSVVHPSPGTSLAIQSLFGK
jgi:pilus assembly protein CpaB